jgi:hypothetical protein
LAVLLAGNVLSAKDFNEKKVVVNLAVISDTHVNGYNGVPGYKFRSALIQDCQDLRSAGCAVIIACMHGGVEYDTDKIDN